MQELQEELAYDPESGYFFWLKPKKGRDLTRPAGSMTHQGYRNIRIGPHLYPAHRLAWLFIMGVWPDTFVGFKDNNPQNTKWENLVLKSKEETYAYVKTKLKCNYDDAKEQQRKQATVVKQRATFSNEDVTKAIEEFMECQNSQS